MLMIHEWFQQRKNDLIDIGLVVLLLPPTFVWATRSHSLALAAAPVLAQTLPLLVRRRYPLIVLGIVLAASISTQFVIGALPPFALALAIYTVAAHTERRVSLGAGALTLLALPLVLIQRVGLNTGESLMHLVVFVAAAWILGDNLRTKRAYYRELEERADRLEREREENVRRATTEEQERIARELHDVIAHSVSVMVVQAAAAGDVFEKHRSEERRVGKECRSRWSPYH